MSVSTWLGRVRLLIMAGSLAASACTFQTSRWTLFVSNSDANELVVVRVTTRSGQYDWLLHPSEAKTLFNQLSPESGAIALLDPKTCSILALADLPRTGAPIAVLSRGVSGDGPWEILMDVSAPQGERAEPPDFGGCAKR
jgi:hypothetical protein